MGRWYFGPTAHAEQNTAENAAIVVHAPEMPFGLCVVKLIASPRPPVHRPGSTLQDDY